MQLLNLLIKQISLIKKILSSLLDLLGILFVFPKELKETSSFKHFYTAEYIIKQIINDPDKDNKIKCDYTISALKPSFVYTIYQQ